jgi:hypothetical protein
MRIFVAYGYNPRDQWIKTMVCPIIEAFGAEVVTGEATYAGPSISEVVRSRIRQSDGVIGFLTKRHPENPASTETHYWVLQELAAAYEVGRRVVEVRESGIDTQPGMLGALQRIEYNESERDKCLVEIVKAVGSWYQQPTVRLQLLPEGLANDDIRPLLNTQGLTCSYIIRNGNYEEGPYQATITPIKGGLFIDAPSFPGKSLIRISIKYGNQVWNSDYESLDSYGVYLR